MASVMARSIARYRKGEGSLTQYSGTRSQGEEDRCAYASDVPQLELCPQLDLIARQ